MAGLRLYSMCLSHFIVIPQALAGRGSNVPSLHRLLLGACGTLKVTSGSPRGSLLAFRLQLCLQHLTTVDLLQLLLLLLSVLLL